MTDKKWERIQRKAQRQSKAARKRHRAVAELQERVTVDLEDLNENIGHATKNLWR